MKGARRRLRDARPRRRKREKLGVRPILRLVAALRRSIPILDRSTSRRPDEARLADIYGPFLETEEDLRWSAVVEALAKLASDLDEAVERRRAHLAREGS